MSSKAKEPRTDYKALQKTVNQWFSEAESTRARNLSATTARLAASGARPDTPYWMRQMQQVEEQYKQDIKDIEKSSTYRMVRNWQKDIAAKEATQKEKLERQSTIDEYLPGWSKPDLAESGVFGMSTEEIKNFAHLLEKITSMELNFIQKKVEKLDYRF